MKTAGSARGAYLSPAAPPRTDLRARSFAFVDFTSTEHATAALINPRNHFLEGRTLVVEYASPDAVRRGAVRPKPTKRAGPRPEARDEAGDGRPHAQRPPRARDEPVSAPADVAPEERREERWPPAQHSADGGDGARARGGVGGGGREKGPRVRPKPGAALALAKRESAAIVPSAGRKITF